MKRIIDGKRYDTQTATAIASDQGGGGKTDFSHWHETLYRTQNGAWFIHGQGGAMSRWSEPAYPNGRQGGEGILPLTDELAQEWLTVHANQLVESFFDVTDA